MRTKTEFKTIKIRASTWQKLDKSKSNFQESHKGKWSLSDTIDELYSIVENS